METNRNGEVDVLTELNKDLQNELKSTLSKRTTEKGTQNVHLIYVKSKKKYIYIYVMQMSLNVKNC